MTPASLAMVLVIVMAMTKAIITMMIYSRIIIMTRSLPMSSPVNMMAWFRCRGTKSRSLTSLASCFISSSDMSSASASFSGGTGYFQA